MSDEKDYKNGPISSTLVRDVEEVGEKDVFAVNSSSENVTNFRTTGWVRASVVMTKTQIGLGVLSIPAAMQTLGAAVGLVVLFGLGIITAWSNHASGKFKMAHPSVHSTPDTALVIFGKGAFGQVAFTIVSICYFLFMTLISASSMLSLSIAFNTLGEGMRICTVAYVGIAAASIFVIATMRKLDHISWVGWIAMFCIVVSVMIVVIATAQAGPAKGNEAEVFDKKLAAGPAEGFASSMNAVVNILFAFAGTPSYPAIYSEMRDPERDYYKAVHVQQVFTLIFYFITGVILWYYGGQYITSPALGTAGAIFQKISYGIAIPALLVSGLLYAHFASKQVFVRLMRGSKHLVEPTIIHWTVWLTTVACVVVFCFIVANAIPFFDSLLGLVGSLFASLFCVGLPAMMWLDVNRHNLKTDTSLWFRSKVVWAGFLIILGAFLCIAGAYGTIVGIKTEFDTELEKKLTEMTIHKPLLVLSVPRCVFPYQLWIPTEEQSIEQINVNGIRASVYTTRKLSLFPRSGFSC
ncbi:amino acid transporter [Wallemia mellicola]|uniref:Amino acid transporter n=1 Tax=Wallemia mellicola TaxID=1708541 RepID=A0AB38MWK9_9BASI|nr:amino acid transporter [Wallemia mellicola]TIC67722.1 amino acid transporter [Wallemia mellicola]